MATGVARPSAQGQAMTSTEIPIPKAKLGDSKKQNTIKLSKAIKITIGTKKKEILSANLEIGA